MNTTKKVAPAHEAVTTADERALTPTPADSVPVSLADCVDANPWFASLTALQQRELLSGAEPLELIDGALLIGAGALPAEQYAGLYVLLKGRIMASRMDAQGQEAVLGYFAPGQWLGESIALGGQPALRDLRSVGPSSLLAITAERFVELMNDASMVAGLARLQAARERVLLSLLEDFCLRSALSRTARRLVLLTQDDDLGVQTPRDLLDISHEALASMLGMTRQTLSAQLKRLNAQGAISQGYGHIRVISHALLAAEAASDR